jgi:hypothetical protein
LKPSTPPGVGGFLVDFSSEEPTLNWSDVRRFCRPVVRDLDKVLIIRESCHGSAVLEFQEILRDPRLKPWAAMIVAAPPL